MQRLTQRALRGMHVSSWVRHVKVLMPTFDWRDQLERCICVPDSLSYEACQTAAPAMVLATIALSFPANIALLLAEVGAMEEPVALAPMSAINAAPTLTFSVF